MYFRVYLKNDANIFKGIDPNKINESHESAKREHDQIWLNVDTGNMVHIINKEIRFYNVSKMPGDSSFIVYLFPDLEKKSIDEILKKPEVKEIKETKKKVKK